MSQITTMLADQGFVKQITTRVQDAQQAQRFFKMFATAIHKTPKLLQCTPESVKIAAYNLAELNLSPIAAHGQAYLIPYQARDKIDCQLQIGWRGLVAMALRDGAVRSINAELVYKGEKFKCFKGTLTILEHEIDFFADVNRNFDNIVGGYAVAELKDGGKVFEVMSIQQLLEHKKRYHKPSKSGIPGPWETAPEEMMRKTLVKRLCKYLPVSQNDGLLRAIEIDNEAIEIKDITPEAKVANVTDAIKNDLISHELTPEIMAQDVIDYRKRNLTAEEMTLPIVSNEGPKFAINVETGEISAMKGHQYPNIDEVVQGYISSFQATTTLPELDDKYKRYFKSLTKQVGVMDKHYKLMNDAADIHKAKLQAEI